MWEVTESYVRSCHVMFGKVYFEDLLESFACEKNDLADLESHS